MNSNAIMLHWVEYAVVPYDDYRAKGFDRFGVPVAYGLRKCVVTAKNMERAGMMRDDGVWIKEVDTGKEYSRTSRDVIMPWAEYQANLATRNAYREEQRKKDEERREQLKAEQTAKQNRDTKLREVAKQYGISIPAMSSTGYYWIKLEDMENVLEQLSACTKTIINI